MSAQAEFLTMDLMMALDAVTIGFVEQEFEERGGQVTRVEFCEILQCYLPSLVDTRASGVTGGGDDASRTRLAESDLIRNLMELFAEIDTNGDAVLEWHEFAAFIVDKVRCMRLSLPPPARPRACA